MKDSLDLQQTILQSLKGLPESSLREIVEYIFFVRQKTLSPDQFMQQFKDMMMMEELSTLERNESFRRRI